MADHGHQNDNGHGAGHGHAGGRGHEPGTMEIRDKEKTFAGFVRMVTWGIGISIGILIFMALVNS